MRQPVAIDLRNIIGAMRIAGDLERIGDMAKKYWKKGSPASTKARGLRP